MAINKVIYGANTLIDISDSTLEANDVVKDKIFYKNDGTQATGNYEWNWLGFRPEFVKTVYNQTILLKNTDYPNWEASTTAGTLKATSNADTFTADMGNYEYIIKWEVRSDFAYPDGTILKAAPIRECAVIYQQILKRPNSVANIGSNNYVGNGCVTLYTAPLNVYYSTSGALTYTYSISYGLYPAAQAATFSSSTSNTPTVTVKTPVLYAKCNKSYFSTAMATAIDQTNTKFTVKGELYRVPKGATLRSMYESLIDLYNKQL